ncbi:hypothetical protein Rsub_08697 [Raphidocelis subcapitata]|uniref:EF-hand domain-containing protein n=1 Tax=Raphidocelis subcapitata TaxID=307507 RepID=A0A2V0PF52_9CHLO|nr:hypothetical protein Rsub_08697 [Raphidocelis subcapitata]|eukprot:GBF95715.1 hypothetical protein Rsub_08697 [Raphidocelis subcapitata]
MLAGVRSVRFAAKTPVPSRASVPAPVTRRTPARNIMVGVTGKDDLAGAAKDLASKAAEAIKKLDVENVKGAIGDAANFSMETAKQSIDAALAVWSKFDADGDGKLSISEAVDLLNSKDLSAAIEKLTGMPHTHRTEADIKKWFSRADFDKSGTLSKREFTVMYVGLLADKAKVGAGGMAQAICTALDRDGDGMIGSTEFKKLIESSPLAPVAAMIPDGMDINYRQVLAGKK